MIERKELRTNMLIIIC